VEEFKEERSSIPGFYEAFQKYLIAGLTQDSFADLYAQTITYGLFAARTRCEDGFNRKLAYDYIPRTIGILRDVFRFISLEELPKQMEWIVDDISEVLAVADVNEILRKFYHEGKGQDLAYYFYETFLAEYNPEERERRGVYYTPQQVVSYIVRSLNISLKEHFQKDMGLASRGVTVLDPAAGTLTFLAEASKLALEEFIAKYGEGGKQSFTKEHILKNFYAFELMMAPYAIGHLKMALLLQELGYKLSEDERFKFYLTNTLEMEELEQTVLPGMASLAEESHLAGKVKKEKPILVILGNPPYSGISANKGKWITDLIEGYKYVDGKHFGEKKHWLQDDYVKFIRFAQWKIDQNGEGVLGFITNHSYLDNPTFRGMRQALMNSFNEIYVLDLHGNSLKKERCPDGSKDENVFDIQQGVAISLFIKRKGSEKKVFHSECWGLKEDKYNWLLANDIKTTNWQQLKPNSPHYFFVPRAETYRDTYDKYWKITDIFPINCTGIVTARDKFVIDFDRDVLKRRIEMFRDLSVPDEIVQRAFKLKENYMWRVNKARINLNKVKNWDTYFAEEAQGRKANLNPKLVESLAEAYGKEPTPEEIFYYIYGALYSNIYRSKYAEFLKFDFPRVPFTKSHGLFRRMAKYGRQLVELHSLKSAGLSNPIAKFQGSGNYRVETSRYNEKEKRVYINDDQYFEGIGKEVWEYQIGGYQVLDKWLKDRKGSKLSLEDIKHYCQVVTALKRTTKVQKEIDNIYPDIEKETVNIKLARGYEIKNSLHEKRSVCLLR